MKYIINPMDKKSALDICSWTYEGPYSIYNLSQDDEYVEEFLNGYYYSVGNVNGEIIGFFCFGETAQVPCGESSAYRDNKAIDIGLGMKPDYTGKGLGKEFVIEGLKLGGKLFSSNKFRLTVATFNKRAIKVYESLGFQKDTIFILKNSGGNREFMTMIKEN